MGGLLYQVEDPLHIRLEVDNAPEHHCNHHEEVNFHR